MTKHYAYIGLIFLFTFFLKNTFVAQCTATSVPYYEDFQSITVNNQLPGCWAASNLSATCLTFTGSTNYAAFSYSPSTVNYFYSRAVQLLAGATYSAALFYKTDNSGNTGWTDLSILRGSSQSTTGLVSLAGTGGPPNGPNFSLLSNTFVVPSSGVYYIAVRGTAALSSAPQFLNWDDLSITFKCGPGSVNSPTVKATASSYTVCSGDPTQLSAIGASNYMWHTGSTSPNTVVSPTLNPTTYTVWGVDALTGCVGNASVTIRVDPLPSMSVVPNPSIACAGQSVTLTATGANTYAWSNGSIGSPITVAPGTTNTFSVIGTNSFGCNAMVSITLPVNPAPTLTVSASRYTICEGEQVVLTCGGALTHTWSYSGGMLSGASFSVSPMSSSTFTANGIDAKGCIGESTLAVTVAKCNGLAVNSLMELVRVFPNPNKGSLTIESGNVCMAFLFDVSGRELMRMTVNGGIQNINLSDLSSGLYYLKIMSGERTEVLKIVKE